MAFQAKVSINGSPLQLVTLSFWDEFVWQKRFRGVARLPDNTRPLLFDLDEWNGFHSLRVLNAFDSPLAGNCSLWCEVEGQPPIEIADFRYLCGFRRTWGTVPRCAPKQTMFGLEPIEVDWPIESIPPMVYGKLVQPGFLAPGARAMLSVDHVNWVLDAATRRRYCDAAIHLPVHAVDANEPFALIARSGFLMGFNQFSAAGMHNARLDIKVNFSHASSLTMWDALITPSGYAIDETLAWGHAAVMQAHWLQGEVRKQARALNAAIHGWCWSGSPFLEENIQAQLAAYENRAADVFSIPGGRKQDTASERNGKPNPHLGQWYVPLWEFAYLAYAIDYALRVGLIDRSDYLANLLDFFRRLAPNCPYWIYLSGNVRPEDDLAYILANNAGIREAEARVVGWLMLNRRIESPWRLDTLMDDPHTYPPSQHVGFHVTAPERREVPPPGVIYTRFREPTLSAAGHQEQAIAVSPVLTVGSLHPGTTPDHVGKLRAISKSLQTISGEIESLATEWERG